MRKNSDINFLFYFNEVFDFHWLGVRMMYWLRVHVRISLNTCICKKYNKN